MNNREYPCVQLLLTILGPYHPRTLQQLDGPFITKTPANAGEFSAWLCEMLWMVAFMVRGSLLLAKTAKM